MNKIYKIVLAMSFVLFFFGTTLNVKAQTDGGFSFHFGLAAPLGDFGDIRMEDGDSYDWPDRWVLTDDEDGKLGGAGVGLNFGLKGKIGTKVEGLGVILSADVIWNRMNSDIRDYRKERVDYALDPDEGDYDEYKLRLPNYFNIPLMVGANYNYQLTDAFGVWGEGAIGINARFITAYKTAYEYTYGENDYRREGESKTSYDPAVSLAFQLGGGIMLNENISIGLHYYALGTAKVKGEYEWESYYTGSEGSDSDHDSESFKGNRLTANTFMVRIGFHM